MSIISVADCLICKRPDIVNINRDWINRYSVPEILVKRGIDQTKEIVSAMIFHGLNHVTNAALAIARQVLEQDAHDLVNTVYETNMQIIQLREDRKMVLQRMENETDNVKWQKLMKNLIDIHDKTTKAVKQQHVISGKDAQQEVAKVSLMLVAKEGMKQLNKSKTTSEILADVDKKKRKVIDHIFDPSNLDMIMEKLNSTPDYIESNIIDVTPEVGEDIEEDDEDEDE